MTFVLITLQHFEVTMYFLGNWEQWKAGRCDLILLLKNTHFFIHLILLFLLLLITVIMILLFAPMIYINLNKIIQLIIQAIALYGPCKLTDKEFYFGEFMKKLDNESI